MLKTKNIMALAAAAIWTGSLLVHAPLPAAAQQRGEFPPGPVITIQLANLDELCSAANIGEFESHDTFARAVEINIRLLPGDDKAGKILKCAADLDLAAQQGVIPRELGRVAISWVLTSCETLRELNLVDGRTCAEVRLIRDRV